MTTHSKTKCQSAKWYQDCRLPLDVFIDCLFDKDYERLIVKGEPTEAQLLEAWQKIYVEYADLLNEGSGNELYQKTIDINYLATKCFVVDKIIKHFHLSFNSELLKILYWYGVDNGIKENDLCEERIKKLQFVVHSVKRWLVELDVLQADFDKLQSEQTDKKGGSDFFEDCLTNISFMRKYSVRPKDITVRQFCKALRAMEQEHMRLTLKNS